MGDIFIILIGILAIAFLVFMLLKKNDIKMTLFSLGLVLMYISIFMGKSLKVTQTTGLKWLEPFQAVMDQFTQTLVGPGFVILILGGYSAYMNSIGANQITVAALTKPIKKVKSIYILIPIVFLLGNLLSLVIPSASNLAIILLATLYPVLRISGMSRLTAAALIGTSATIIPTPLGSDNVAIAAQLGMPVTEYVFKYHAMVSIPTLLVIAVVHYIWQKRLDKKSSDFISYEEELKIADRKETNELENVEYKGLLGFVYGILPLLPIVILLIVFILNQFTKTQLNLSVQVVTFISFLVAVLVEILEKRKFNKVLSETSSFFEGMGSVIGVVALLVAASTFVQGLTSLGIMELIQNLMKNINGAGMILPILMVIFTAIIVLLSGSGMALLFAMIPLILPLSKAAGISPEALSVPMQLAGNLFRAVSPVAAVVLIVAGTTKASPVQIVKRTSVPMLVGVLTMMVLSLVLF